MNGGYFLILLDHERRRRERLRCDSFDREQEVDDFDEELDDTLRLWGYGIGAILGFAFCAYFFPMA